MFICSQTRLGVIQGLKLGTRGGSHMRKVTFLSTLRPHLSWEIRYRYKVEYKEVSAKEQNTGTQSRKEPPRNSFRSVKEILKTSYLQFLTLSECLVKDD